LAVHDHHAPDPGLGRDVEHRHRGPERDQGSTSTETKLLARFNDMKRTLIAVAFLTGLLAVQAQERMPREEALKATLFVSGDLKEMLNTPIPTDPDLKRPVGVADDDRHAIVLPEFELSADTFAKAGKEPKPLGQLWLHNLVPENEGQRVPASKLHTVHVHAMETEADVVCCALGVCKRENGGLELLIYSKDKEPVTRVAMKSISAQQENPIEISAERKDHSELITLKFLGKYEGTFALSAPD
jgi:hypothetical protein